MRFVVFLCAAFWMVPAWAQDAAAPELPAGEMSVEELPDVVEPPAAIKSSEPITTKELPEVAEPEKPAAKPFNAVVLKGLNKVTARSTTLTANFGTVMRFGNLEIIPHRCVERQMQGVPDAAALLEIWELKPDTSPTKLFMGWMFSSNQAVSSLEHPVYDVWVEKCLVKEIKE